MVTQCLLEDILYSLLTLITVLCLIVQFVYTLRYPWYLFGEFETKIGQKPFGNIRLKLWFYNNNGQHASTANKNECPDVEIFELKSVEEFQRFLFPNYPFDYCNIGRTSGYKMELIQPLHVAIPTSSHPVACRRHVGSHHFVVTDIERLTDQDDYLLTTLEYDGTWSSSALLKSCQLINGQVQRKQRYLSVIFQHLGSLFVWRRKRSSVGRSEVIERFSKFNGEVSWELVMNNCEHFVNYLLGNEHVSYQVLYAPLIKCIFGRSLAGLLRGHLSFTGLLRASSMILAHVLNALAPLLWVPTKEKYEIMWLIVTVIELIVLMITDGLYFRQVMQRAFIINNSSNTTVGGAKSPEPFTEILNGLLFFFSSTASFSLGALLGHFRPSCDPCIWNEIFLSAVFTIFALGCLHPVAIGFTDWLFYKSVRQSLYLQIVTGGEETPVEFEIEKVNVWSTISVVMIYLVVGLHIFVLPLLVLINFDELEDYFEIEPMVNCTWIYTE